MDLTTWLRLLDQMYPDTVPDKYCRGCGWHGNQQDLYLGQGCPVCRGFVADYNNTEKPT